MGKNDRVNVFESPLKIEKLVYSKKDMLWRLKAIVMRVDRMHDSIKADITLNPAPFEEQIDRLKREIESAKKQPDLFDNSEVKELQSELKEEEANHKERAKTFGRISFTAVIEALAQKDNGRTSLTIIVPRDIVPAMLEKIAYESDNLSRIEFYV